MPYRVGLYQLIGSWALAVPQNGKTRPALYFPQAEFPSYTGLPIYNGKSNFMSPFLEQSEFFKQSIRLSEEQKADQYEILENFFCDYNLRELRTIHREVLDTCLTTDLPPFGVADRRADILLYHRKMEKLLEAVFFIVQGRNDGWTGNNRES
jgi:hypothetical protein